MTHGGRKARASAVAADEVTCLLNAWEEGDEEALSELMTLVYDELRFNAEAYFSKEGVGHTLQPTALVNEVYMRLVGRRKVQWQNRTQFFAFAGQMMRRVLIDHARIKFANKRGGRSEKVSLDESMIVPGRDDIGLETLLALSDALVRLTAIDPRQAKIVEYRFFSGLSNDEIAQVMEISLATVKRDWKAARPWLARELGSAPESSRDTEEGSDDL